MGLSDLFVDVSSLPDGTYGLVQLTTLLVYYGYVLFVSANMIGDGSELLLLVPSFAGIVGSCVLPILGAVPDGMIVLFSGMGPDAQEQLDVGVGALAGSTIMLITLPWLLAIYAGSVDIENGVCKYTKEGKKAKGPVIGVKNSDGVRVGGAIMLITSLCYLVIQIPAIFFESEGATTEEVAESEKFFAAIGFFVTVFMFLAYLKYQVDNQEKNSVANKTHVELVIKLIEADSDFTLRLALFSELQHHKAELLRRLSTAEAPPDMGANYQAVVDDSFHVWRKLPVAAHERITDIITYFWIKFVKLHRGHGVIGSGAGARIEISALRKLFLYMGDNIASDHLDEVFVIFDKNQNKTIELPEFIKGTCQYLWEFERSELEASDSARAMERLESKIKESESAGDDAEEDEESEDEMPDELKELDPKEQQRRLISMSFQTMGIGTFLVVLFSDPMCDVLAEIGTRTGIPAFYVSFVLAPLASNAAELLAAFKYASNKSEKTIGIALQQLQGAACMNNTFCLSIFMGLIYFRSLAWEYFAETLSILLCQCIIAYVSRMKYQTMNTAYLVASVYPSCLLLVAWLEAIGYD